MDNPFAAKEAVKLSLTASSLRLIKQANTSLCRQGARDARKRLAPGQHQRMFGGIVPTLTLRYVDLSYAKTGGWEWWTLTSRFTRSANAASATSKS